MLLGRSTDAGAYVRRLRHDAGLSQTELAARVDITRQLLSRFEQGKSDLPFGVVMRLLRELDASVDVRTRAERAAIVEVRLPRIPQVDLTGRQPPRITAPRLDAIAVASLEHVVAGLSTSREETLQTLATIRLPDAVGRDDE